MANVRPLPQFRQPGETTVRDAVRRPAGTVAPLLQSLPLTGDLSPQNKLHGDVMSRQLQQWDGTTGVMPQDFTSAVLGLATDPGKFGIIAHANGRDREPNGAGTIQHQELSGATLFYSIERKPTPAGALVFERSSGIEVKSGETKVSTSHTVTLTDEGREDTSCIGKGGYCLIQLVKEVEQRDGETDPTAPHTSGPETWEPGFIADGWFVDVARIQNFGLGFLKGGLKPGEDPKKWRTIEEDPAAHGRPGPLVDSPSVTFAPDAGKKKTGGEPDNRSPVDSVVIRYFQLHIVCCADLSCVGYVEWYEVYTTQGADSGQVSDFKPGPSPEFQRLIGAGGSNYKRYEISSGRVERPFVR